MNIHIHLSHNYEELNEYEDDNTENYSDYEYIVHIYLSLYYKELNE